MERETDLGSAPTERNDLRLLIDHVRTLVQHGDDPIPWLPRLAELRVSASADLQLVSGTFEKLVGNYLRACADGTPEASEWKAAVENFSAHGPGAGANPAPSTCLS